MHAAQRLLEDRPDVQTEVLLVLFLGECRVLVQAGDLVPPDLSVEGMAVFWQAARRLVRRSSRSLADRVPMAVRGSPRSRACNENVDVPLRLFLRVGAIGLGVEQVR